MSTSIATFILNTVNTSIIVSSSRLDKTIKAIINNKREKGSKYSRDLIEYLNILRVIYYIKRLKYKNHLVYRQTLSKFITTFVYYYYFTNKSNR